MKPQSHSLRTLLTAALVAIAPACGDDDDGLSPIAPITPDTSDRAGTDTGPADTAQPEPEIVEPGPNRLTYLSGQLNAAGSPCVESCFLRATAGDKLEIAVRYVGDSGHPLAEQTIRFSTGDTPTSVFSLNSLSGYTDADGVAKVELRSHGVAGSVDVTVTPSRDPDVAPLRFTVTFDPRPFPDLAVGFEYRGRGPVSEFSLRAWKQTDAAPGCAAVHPDVRGAPAPDVEAGPFRIGTQAKVDTLPGLAADGQQRWTVMLVGDAGGHPYASGCVENVEAVAGATAEAWIYILDLPLNFRGDFEVVTRVDTLSGGTGTPIGNTLVTLTELFTRPGGLIVRWACEAADGGTLGTVCNFLVNGSGELSLTGSVVAGFADGALLGLLADAIGEDNQQAATLIAEILRELRFVSTMSFADEPSTPKSGFPGAWFAGGDTAEEWEAVRFRWKFDPTCKQSPDPTECGWTTIPMEEIYGHRPTAQLSAGIDGDANLHVDLHRVPTLTFGPLINGIVEKRLLSLFFASGATTPVSSWEDLIGVLLGDRECLYYNDCCDIFAERISDDVPVWVAKMACDAAIPLVAGVIRNRFASLDGALNLGTTAEGPCASVDHDADRWVDGYGEQHAMCGWNMFFETRSGPYFMTNSWRARID